MILFLYFITFLILDTTFAQCFLDVKSPESLLVVDINLNTPNYSQNVAYFEYGSSFFVQCLRGRYNPSIAEDGDLATCEESGKILIRRTSRVLNYNTTTCTEKLPIKVLNTSNTCNVFGTTFEVGYEIYKNFSTVFTACFDEISLSPSYVEYNFVQKTFISAESTFQFFDSGNVYGGTDIQNLFVNQKNTFDNLNISEYLSEDTYLMPGQLLPTSLLSYPFERYATMDYINVFPIWSNYYNFYDWPRLLVQFQQMCSGHDKYYFRTGAIGVASLTDSQNKTVYLYLNDNNQVPVPRYLWSNSCNRTLLLYNNPYFEVDEVYKELESMRCVIQNVQIYEQLFVAVCEAEVLF